MTDSQKNILYRLGFLFLISMAVYGNTLNNGFVWDDNSIIVNNPLIEKLGNIPRLFLSEDTVDETTGYYRPVTYISFALEWAVWGLNPTGFHFINLTLHIAVVLLFYRVIAALFSNERLAFNAALIFALHPLTGETVNFLSGGRNTLLSACFALLSLLCFIKNRNIAAVACFTIAIFSKEFALLLPVIFLLYAYRVQRKIIRYATFIPYLFSIAVYLTLRSFAVQYPNFLAATNMQQALTAPYLVFRYALNMVFPMQLHVMYDIQPHQPVLIVCTLAMFIVTGAIYIFRKYDEILFSFCWFLLFLLPVINIIPINSTSVMADRYAYFSLMGFAIYLAALLCMLNKRVVTAGVVILMVFYACIDFSRNKIWKNEFSFFTQMAQDAPEKFIGFRNLGLYYYRNGEIERALFNLEVADSKQDIAAKHLIGDVYIFWKENRLEKAEKTLFQVMKDNPSNPEPYLLLMMIYEQKQNTTLADSYRDKLKKMGLDVGQILTNRTIELCRIAETFTLKRQLANAEIYLWQVLRINPSFIPALVDMGSIRAGQGDFTNAIRYFSKALTLDSSNASAHNNLSMVYQMQGRAADAQAEMIRFTEAKAIGQQKGKSESR